MALNIERFRQPSLSTRLSFLHPNYQITSLLAFQLSHHCTPYTMAPFNLTDANGINNIFTFGRYYQTMVAQMEPDVVFDDRSVLHFAEASFIERIALHDEATAARTCRERLDLPLDYYYAVKHQITSFQRVWDAVLEEKRRYDAVGWLGGSRNFMDCFQVCSYLIPQRVSIGFFGPCDTSIDNTPMPNHPTAYQSGASTVVNSPTRYAEYERSIPDRDHGERFLSDEEEYPETLALSPTDSDESFEDVEQDGEPEIISISSDENDSDGEYSDGSDGSDGSDNNENKELQFPLELDGGNVPDSGIGEPGQFQGDLDDAMWERLFRSLPDTQQLHEETQRIESVREQPSVPRVGKSLSRGLEDVPKKRKAVHPSNTRGKRQRTA